MTPEELEALTRPAPLTPAQVQEESGGVLAPPTVAPDVAATWKKPPPELSEDELKREMGQIDEAAAEQDRRGKRKAKLARAAEDFLKDIEGKPSVNFPGLAAWVVKDLGLKSYAGELWVNHDGIYIHDFGIVKATITEVFNAGQVKHAISGAVAEIRERALNTNPCREYPFNIDRDLIPVANGVIRLAHGKIELLPSDPAYHFNYRLPVKYDPAAPTEPVMRVLRSWVSEDDVPSLVQFPSQAILQSQERVPYKRAYLFDGERDSGKSTFWLLIHAFFGDDQTGNVELGSIGENRFAISSLEGKLINFYDDLGAFPIKYLGPFKKVTGSVWHEIERKGKDPYNGLITAVHGFSCNGPPILKDLFDEAFFSRWNYVDFPYSFPPDPLWPVRTFTPEFLSGYLNLVLEMMIRIKKNGRLPHVMNGLAVQERWAYATEPVKRFVDEELVKTAGSWAETEEVWQRWVQWATANKIDPRTKTTLTQRLAPLGIAARQKGAGGKIRGYEGVVLKNPSQLGKKCCILCHQDVQAKAEPASRGTWPREPTFNDFITTEPDGESRTSLGLPPVYMPGRDPD